jgi:hypothetical protein
LVTHKMSGGCRGPVQVKCSVLTAGRSLPVFLRRRTASAGIKVARCGLAPFFRIWAIRVQISFIVLPDERVALALIRSRSQARTGGGGQVSVHFVAFIDRRVPNAQRHLLRSAQWCQRRVQRRIQLSDIDLLPGVLVVADEVPAARSTEHLGVLDTGWQDALVA